MYSTSPAADARARTSSQLSAALSPDTHSSGPRVRGALPARLRGGDPLQQRVDSREAALRALLDAVLHRRVTLFGGLEAHRLRQLRLVAEILELERLQMVLECLHETLGRLDLAKLALDDAEGGLETVGAAGAHVHLLDDGPVAPPFGDQLRVRPDGEHVGARRVEDALDPDLELGRG